ncbi:MAG: hypothetical protein GY765_29195 [bacterium]|nr:hypothetical protein [bacterium]
MEQETNLSTITDDFVMELGSSVLQDIDTPSFMRKEYDVPLVHMEMSHQTGMVHEPDQKIINFLSVIKRKDLVLRPV